MNTNAGQYQQSYGGEPRTFGCPCCCHGSYLAGPDTFSFSDMTKIEALVKTNEELIALITKLNDLLVRLPREMRRGMQEVG